MTRGEYRILDLRNRVIERLENARSFSCCRSVRAELDGIFQCFSELEAHPEEFGTSEQEITALYKKGKIVQAKVILLLLIKKSSGKSVRREVESFLERLGQKGLTFEDIGATNEGLQDLIKKGAILEVNEALRKASQLSDEEIAYLQKILVDTQAIIKKYGLKSEGLEIGPAIITELCLKVIKDIQRRLTSDFRSVEPKDIDDLKKLLDLGDLPYRKARLYHWVLSLIRTMIKFRKRFERRQLFGGLRKPFFFSLYHLNWDAEILDKIAIFQDGFSVTSYYSKMAAIYLSGTKS